MRARRRGSPPQCVEYARARHGIGINSVLFGARVQPELAKPRDHALGRDLGKYALGGGSVVVPRADGARKGHVASAVAGREQLFAHAPLLLEHEHIVPTEPRGEIQPRRAASYDSGIENHLSPSLEQTRGRPRAHRGCPPPHGSSRRESGHFAESASLAGSSAGVHTFTICAAKLSATLRSTV